ncbi:MAG: DUF4249 family protein [Bacteroidota bacterium]
MRLFFYSIVLMIVLFACNLEQEIELDLPAYEEKVIVEAYLKAGENYQLLLSRSSSFFSPFPTNIQETVEQLLLNGAEVVITHQGNQIVLDNVPVIDPESGKIFNYSSNQTIPFDTINPFELSITLDDGSIISSTTQFLPVIPIDSIVYEFSGVTRGEDSARVLTYFNDPRGQENFYRRTIYKYKAGELEEQQDFTSDDRIVEDVVVFGTGYNFKFGDTVLNRIYHINEDYYLFLNSLQFAVDANGNPFGQPSPIISGVQSSDKPVIGIFTTLSFSEEVTIIER